MNKATHKIKLKSTKILVRSSTKKVLGIDFLNFLFENEGEFIEAKKAKTTVNWDIGNGWFISPIFVTDLKPIKPVIEIPETPFWVLEPQSHEFMEVIELVFGKYRVCDSFITKAGLKRYLNNGTWEIVDEPKKEMRPFTHEEWKEWFLNDGVYMLQGGSLYRALGISSRKMIVLADMDDYDPNKFTGTPILDRHGNKFEKELER